MNPIFFAQTPQHFLTMSRATRPQSRIRVAWSNVIITGSASRSFEASCLETSRPTSTNLSTH
ncbi:hypothetical protein PAXRUDRAFT_833795 [Paxillus rubicundulus Ve08.2h10]|uniref:Uncharacterized protein n=1 Tax=Paxillus rubicundulus Ve08.2h10 TaxID=930991 RepID=A0A0D0DN86_9AGAM|nr:hypothetical protein PAXRUDRAFT_833795 [Paxillus rubicundulus Ve08.2h10]